MESLHRVEEIRSSMPSVDPQWQSGKFLILSKNSGAVQIVEKFGKYSVNAAGDASSKNATFKVHYGVKGHEHLMMFECLSEQPKGWMIAVDDNGNLTCKKRVVDYHNFTDAEPDVTFVSKVVDHRSESRLLYSKKAGGYVGFDRDGSPIPLKKVKQDSKAAEVYLDQASF